MAVYTRLLRADMITTLQQDSITMARAKGIPTSRILFRHALRPSSFSLMTVVGLQVGDHHRRRGDRRDPVRPARRRGGCWSTRSSSATSIMVQGVALVIAVSFVVINFIVDLLYTLLDPRIRHGSAATA